ncbi:Dihydrodipicolinate synthase/N-acetylneuraminate lyase [Devosia enhydra]|uniref:Dihydrodipicolinate synthase/N-acetylneuraminate lyase n=2 Tax=Devosia enhydra TaxID=665118 RepID=A0A1K2HZG0_9HYPH|nr:Dihydrodipicolinate synthase/N-acetylneuraminate lyase [Devosia enhydra]
MARMNPAGPKGTWASLLLPIGEDDAIDFARLADGIAALIATGVDGIYSNGTAGEFYAQTEAEFDAIQGLLAAACQRAGMAFVIGACHSDPVVQMARIRRAAALSPLAIQVILPDWWPVTNGEARAFIERASDAAGPVPLVLYNPPHAKRVLGPADLAEVTRATGVVAAKLTLQGTDFYAEARRHLSHLGVFVPGHHLATGRAEGVAAGAFSNIACLNPLGAMAWQEMMDIDITAGLALETRIRAFISGHILPYAERGFSNAALDKLLARIGGWADIGTRLRAPYASIPDDDALALRPVAMAMIPEIMAS